MRVLIFLSSMSFRGTEEFIHNDALFHSHDATIFMMNICILKTIEIWKKQITAWIAVVLGIVGRSRQALTEILPKQCTSVKKKTTTTTWSWECCNIGNSNARCRLIFSGLVVNFTKSDSPHCRTFKWIVLHVHS